eukprot:TRINITY_DN47417_c0_g1_i1.p1 TRINITY_DN47417_c0_g1~~TRINITY_DN47417_c0_g1_i1.p1  ORF type:complete len:120 (+),score=19.29 TRINITY_DN47417_c0_g1_i1:83-442(+)
MFHVLNILSICFFLMIRRPPRSTLSSSSAASDVYKRQYLFRLVVTTPNRSHTTTVAVDIGVGRDAKECTLFFPAYTQLSRRHCTIHLRFSIEAVKLAPIVGNKRARDCLLYTSPSPRDS